MALMILIDAAKDKAQFSAEKEGATVVSFVKVRLKCSQIIERYRDDTVPIDIFKCQNLKGIKISYKCMYILLWFT